MGVIFGCVWGESSLNDGDFFGQQAIQREHQHINLGIGGGDLGLQGGGFGLLRGKCGFPFHFFRKRQGGFVFFQRGDKFGEREFVP